VYICVCEFFFFFVVLGFKLKTQGLELVRQMVYCFSPASSPFCFGYFSATVLGFLPGLTLNHYLPKYASHIAEVTVAHYHAQLVC
jgi:hypothetical protein